MKSLLLLPALLVAVSLPMTTSVDLPETMGANDWVVDSGHSGCVFQCQHAGAAWFLGTFDRVAGKVTLDPKAPQDGSVSLTIDVESIDTNDAKRDGHLKSPDFFNAKENPEITFRSTKIAADGKHLKVTGDLSMAGETKSITIPVKWTGDGEFHGKRRGYLAEFAVKRSAFGMNYGVAQNVLSDDVKLMVSLELTQAK
ncbi:MAG: YceI family protein [Planctomycetota bacterium]